MAKKALGKGLSSIFEDLGTPILDKETDSPIHEIPLDKIKTNPFQMLKIKANLEYRNRTHEGDLEFD